MSSKNNADISVMMLVPFLPPLPVGGAEMQALKLAESLAQKGIIISFIMPGKPDVKGMIRIAGMPVYRLHSWMNALHTWLSAYKKKKQPSAIRIEYDDSKELTNQITRKVGWPTVIYYNIFFLRALLFLWRRRKSFDIIHAHTMEWSVIVSVRLGRILEKPVIIKDSTMNGFQSLSRFPSGRKLQNMIMANAYFVAMTKIIHNNLLLTGVPEERIFDIPNGIVVGSETLPSVRGRKPAKVLFVGNLYQQPAKGVDILLHAWRIVHAQFPDAVLQIIGDGVVPDYKYFTDRLQISDVVNFLGKQSDLSRYYTEADVFVLPSRREGMSNALMEAMLNGVPCIATDISGSQDLILNNVNGILVPPGNPTLLAEGISYLLSNPDIAQALAERGRETILRDFNIQKVADKYISMYTKILKKESPGITH
ncbi:MAG TPA: glycosyltransferase [Puia sp.]|jgi:glycosyltransferase involved in cell wall biosynthesis|nr:glycosyltransferase [Puia sp.]